MADIIVKITLDEYSDLKNKAEQLELLTKEVIQLKARLTQDTYQFNPQKEIEKR